jgi:hypothetical protein
MADALASRQMPGSNVTQATYLEFLDRYADADNEVRAAVDARKNLRASIKAAGIPLAAFDRTRKDSEKSGEIREHEETWYRRMMAWRHKPVGFQASMDLETDEPGVAALNIHELKRIDNEGFEAGKGGRRRDSNSYTPGTEAYTRWDTAWLRGQAEIAASTAKTPGAAEAARAAGANGGRPRGRPRGSGKKSREPAAAAGEAGGSGDNQQVH